MNIIVDFIDKLGEIMPTTLTKGQQIIDYVDYNGRKIIRTERDDGIFGGAFTKIRIPNYLNGSQKLDIQYVSSTMNEKELKEYIIIEDLQGD